VEAKIAQFAEQSLTIIIQTDNINKIQIIHNSSSSRIIIIILTSLALDLEDG